MIIPLTNLQMEVTEMSESFVGLTHDEVVAKFRTYVQDKSRQPEMLLGVFDRDNELAGEIILELWEDSIDLENAYQWLSLEATSHLPFI
jgi:hypothetical protein